MKKIIALIFVFIGFVGFGFSDTGTCDYDPSAPWCPLWVTNMENKCTDWWWTATIEGSTCICTFNTQSWTKTKNCDEVGTKEEMDLAFNCPWGKFLKGWECCPSWSIAYDNNKKCCNWFPYDNEKKCCEKWVGIRTEWDKCLSCQSKEAKNLYDFKEQCSPDISGCDKDKTYEDSDWIKQCCPWLVVDDKENPGKKTCIINTEWNLWINMNTNCLINWQCSYNIYKTLGIRKSDQTPKVSTFVQDIVLGITMFLGTAITIILIISGILYILAAILGKSNLADMAKKWIFNSILWLVLVSWSYAIVRLVQFVATAGGW